MAEFAIKHAVAELTDDEVWVRRLMVEGIVKDDPYSELRVSWLVQPNLVASASIDGIRWYAELWLDDKTVAAKDVCFDAFKFRFWATTHAGDVEDFTDAAQIECDTEICPDTPGTKIEFSDTDCVPAGQVELELRLEPDLPFDDLTVFWTFGNGEVALLDRATGVDPTKPPGQVYEGSEPAEVNALVTTGSCQFVRQAKIPACPEPEQPPCGDYGWTQGVIVGLATAAVMAFVVAHFVPCPFCLIPLAAGALTIGLFVAHGYWALDRTADEWCDPNACQIATFVGAGLLSLLLVAEVLGVVASKFRPDLVALSLLFLWIGIARARGCLVSGPGQKTQRGSKPG